MAAGWLVVEANKDPDALETTLNNISASGFHVFEIFNEGGSSYLCTIVAFSGTN